MKDSTQVKNENLLKAKMKMYEDNYIESEKRMKSTSSLVNLAGKIYSNSPKKASSSRASTPKKSRRSSSKKHNPQSTNLSKSISSAMSGLSMRASQVSCFAQLNTDLLLEKKEIQNRIYFLKEKIVKEKKKLKNAEHSCKKTRNQVEKQMDFYVEAHKKYEKLDIQVDKLIEESQGIKKEIKGVKERIEVKKGKIRAEELTKDKFLKKGKRLKCILLSEEKQRNVCKGNLSKSQRIMGSSSIYSKELEDQRAVLLLQVNRSVAECRI